MRSLWARFRRFLEQVASMDDSPHHLALGLAIGVFVGFLPIMGIQMWVALPLAMAVKGNKLLAMAGVWISNPVTFIPFYYGCYRFGLLLHEPMKPLSVDQFRDLVQDISMDRFLELGDSLVVPMTLGCTVLGMICGTLTYFGLRVWLARRRVATHGTSTGAGE